MGFFSGIIHGITNTIKQVAPAPVRRVITPVLKVAQSVGKLTPTTLFKYAAQGPVLGPINFAAKTAAPSIAAPLQFGSTLATAIVPGGQAKMGLNLSGILGGLTSGISSFLGGASPATALQNFSSFLPSLGNIGGVGGGAPPLNTNPYAYPTMAAVPAAARAVATVGRSFFAKYPNLATYIQQYRNMGKNVTRAKLYSLMKRFGPELLISGGILSAAAISELMMAGPGRRRMNPGNVKALRRSLRRLESFHHLCVRVDKLRSRRRSSSKSRGGTQQFVRQG